MAPVPHSDCEEELPLLTPESGGGERIYESGKSLGYTQCTCMASV